VQDVRPDRGGHDRGRLGDLAQRRGVGGIGDEQVETRQRRVHCREAAAHGFELAEIAAGERPAAAVRRVAREVVGGQTAGESRGTEQDDVEAAIGHVPTLLTGRRGSRIGWTGTLDR
jgi:hypothetical protein